MSTGAAIRTSSNRSTSKAVPMSQPSGPQEMKTTGVPRRTDSAGMEAIMRSTSVPIPLRSVVKMEELAVPRDWRPTEPEASVFALHGDEGGHDGADAKGGDVAAEDSAEERCADLPGGLPCRSGGRRSRQRSRPVRGRRFSIRRRGLLPGGRRSWLRG